MTKWETEMRNKKEALEMFLGEKVENVCDNIFESESGEEYMVLTDEEADEEVKKYIRESLWAFDADFILNHTVVFECTSYEEDRAIVSALKEMQNKLCETANEIVYALIGDFDQLVEDAVMEDGRGHFISDYDGEENEQNGYYIYRME